MFVPYDGSINNIPTLVQIMAWRRPGDKPLSEPMMVTLSTHICITRPQWVKSIVFLALLAICLNGYLLIYGIVHRKIFLVYVGRCLLFTVFRYDNAVVIIISLFSVMLFCRWMGYWFREHITKPTRRNNWRIWCIAWLLRNINNALFVMWRGRYIPICIIYVSLKMLPANNISALAY